MRRTETIICVIGTLVLAASAEVHAQDSSDMARCAELENADARLACYDEVIGRSSSPPPEPEAAAQAPAPEMAEIAPAPDAVRTEQAPEAAPSEQAPLTQEVGEEQLGSRPEVEPTMVRGRVTDCQKDANRRWYFMFDNGQVWKQRPTGPRLSFPECDFEVTITKDGFGYKMQIEGEEKWIRIGRVR